MQLPRRSFLGSIAAAIATLLGFKPRQVPAGSLPLTGTPLPMVNYTYTYSPEGKQAFGDNETRRKIRVLRKFLNVNGLHKGNFEHIAMPSETVDEMNAYNLRMNSGREVYKPNGEERTFQGIRIERVGEIWGGCPMFSVLIPGRCSEPNGTEKCRVLVGSFDNEDGTAVNEYPYYRSSGGATSWRSGWPMHDAEARKVFSDFQKAQDRAQDIKRAAIARAQGAFSKATIAGLCVAFCLCVASNADAGPRRYTRARSFSGYDTRGRTYSGYDDGVYGSMYDNRGRSTYWYRSGRDTIITTPRGRALYLYDDGPIYRSTSPTWNSPLLRLYDGE